MYCPERCCAFQCDLTKDDLAENVPADSVDVATLIFVLSAVHPDKMKLVLENIRKVRVMWKEPLCSLVCILVSDTVTFKAVSFLGFS